MHWIKTKSVTALILAAVASTAALTRHSSAALESPGPTAEIVFDVERKGDVIGTHEVSFHDTGEADDRRLVVDARFNIAIPFLIFEGYTYTYQSAEEWTSEGLDYLQAEVDDNGDRWQVSAVRQGDMIVVHGPAGVTLTPAPVYPTNHWNPNVLDEVRVLNTITGTIDQVTISPVGEEQVATELGTITATRYRYAGDLETEVLYDRHGRWVGMSFAGKDGARINYLCRRCQGEPRSWTRP
ncbi:MAG: DUF6134 family protein [Rhodospirillales bacterium]